MDIDYFEKLLNEVYEAKLVNEALKSIKEDGVLDGNAVMEELKLKYGFKWLRYCLYGQTKYSSDRKENWE